MTAYFIRRGRSWWPILAPTLFFLWFSISHYNVRWNHLLGKRAPSYLYILLLSWNRTQLFPIFHCHLEYAAYPRIDKCRLKFQRKYLQMTEVKFSGIAKKKEDFWAIVKIFANVVKIRRFSRFNDVVSFSLRWLAEPVFNRQALGRR